MGLPAAPPLLSALVARGVRQGHVPNVRASAARLPDAWRATTPVAGDDSRVSRRRPLRASLIARWTAAGTGSSNLHAHGHPAAGFPLCGALIAPASRPGRDGGHHPGPRYRCEHRDLQLDRRRAAPPDSRSPAVRRGNGIPPPERAHSVRGIPLSPIRCTASSPARFGPSRDSLATT